MKRKTIAEQEEKYSNLLAKYYNKYGQEKYHKGENWSKEHQKEHFREQGLQNKMVRVQQLGFRVNRREKDRVAYIIRLLDRNFNNVNRALSEDQILVMIVCFIRIENDKSDNKSKYFKKMEEFGIDQRTYISFLHKILSHYRQGSQEVTHPTVNKQSYRTTNSCKDCPKRNIFLNTGGNQCNSID